MKIDTIVLYDITDPSGLPEIEEAIRRDDEDAFALYGPYFKEHKGSAYLLNPMDIGMGSDAWASIQERYDPQGGIEITGTEGELDELECLLDSPDCRACRLGDRFLILPSRGMYADLVVCLMQRSGRTERQRWTHLIGALRAARRVLCWPYLYLRHAYQQEMRLRFLAWQSVAAVSLMQFVPLLAGFLAGAILFHTPSSTGRHIAALLFAYLVGGLGMSHSGQIALVRQADGDAEREVSSTSDVEYEGFPLTDVAVGFLIVSVLQLLIGHF